MYGRPVPFPTSCSPQAWASAIPVQLLRTLLRFDPDMPRRKVWLSAAMPVGFRDLTLHHLPLAGSRIELEFVSGRVHRLDGAPPDLEIIPEPHVQGASLRWPDPAGLSGLGPRGETSLELSRVFSDKVAVMPGSDCPDPDVLPAVVHVLLMKPHGRTINPTRPANKDGGIKSHDERDLAGEILKFGWLEAINLQHPHGHGRRDGGWGGE
jgi:hypothetical protein